MFCRQRKSGIRRPGTGRSGRQHPDTHAGAEQIRRSIKWKKSLPITPSSSAQESAGLYAALKLPKEQNILLICKEDLPSCDSMLAQGGICVQRDETDYDSFFEDTLKAGHYENRKESVDIMIRNSRAVINDLLALGVRFDKEADGSLKYTREGAHAKPRICFHKDITGKEITETLLRNVQALPNVTIMDYTVMEDLLVEGNTCHGIVAKAENGRYPADSCGKTQFWQRAASAVCMNILQTSLP